MNKKLKIYFACSIRGEQGGREEKELIVKTLQDLGHIVLSEIFAKQDIKTNDLVKLSPEQIYERDMNWVKEADLIVADVTRASLGVGYEVGWMIANGNRVLALCKQESYDPLSNMIKGCTEESFKIRVWEDDSSLKDLLIQELGGIND